MPKANQKSNILTSYEILEKLEKCEQILREISSKEAEKSRKESELRSAEGEKQAVHWMDPNHDQITAEIDSRIRSLEGDISSLDSDIGSLESDYNYYNSA